MELRIGEAVGFVFAQAGLVLRPTQQPAEEVRVQRALDDCGIAGIGAQVGPGLADELRVGLSVAALRHGSAADPANASAGGQSTAGRATSTVVGRNDEPVHVAPMRLSFTAKPGQKIAFAAIELRNASHRRGVIEQVTPSRISDGLDVVHIGATDTDNLVGKVVGAQPYDDLYHPEMWLESASGTVLPTRGKTGIQVAFVVAAQQPGRYTMDGATIRYRVGNEVRSMDIPARISLCAAPSGESCRAGDETA